MAKYIFKRIIALIITMTFVAMLTFFIMHAIPGGPFTADKGVSEEMLYNLNEQYGLNDPISVQFANYMKGLLKFDFGPSYTGRGVYVNDMLSSGFKYSANLGLISFGLIVVFGIGMGILAGVKHRKFADNATMVMSLVGVTLPSYVIATLMIYFFSTKLQLLPTNGLSTPIHYIAPLVAMGGASMAFLTRVTRSSMIDVKNQDYIRAAQANGFSKRSIIFKHMLRNALIPIITCIGPLLADVLTGSFVVEKIFAIPGMGRYTVESIADRNYTLLMGVTIFYALFYAIMLLIVDVCYVLADPRIKVSGGKK